MTRKEQRIARWNEAKKAFYHEVSRLYPFGIYDKEKHLIGALFGDIMEAKTNHSRTAFEHSWIDVGDEHLAFAAINPYEREFGICHLAIGVRC